MPEKTINVEKLIERALLGEREKLNFEQKMLIGKISKMENLPIPNSHAMKVMLLLRNEQVKMNELIDSIERDQSLVAKILKLVNSGFYGLRNTVDSVNRAVSLLGIMNIKHVVYSATIMEMFSEDEQLEWNHSYSSSVMMQKLMKNYNIPAANNLPLTTLMHDIGKVVLRLFAPKKFQMAVMVSRNKKKFLHELELESLSVNHAVIAGVLLQKWKMTNDIIIPIIYHHSEEIPDEYVLETAMLQFVNWVDCMARDLPCPAPTPELMREAGIDEVDNQYWINFQEKLIQDLEGGDEEEAVDEKREKISKGKNYYNCAEIPSKEQMKSEENSAIVEKKLSEKELEVLSSHKAEPQAESVEEEQAAVAAEPDVELVSEDGGGVEDTQVIKVKELREELEEERKKEAEAAETAQEQAEVEAKEGEESPEGAALKETHTDKMKKMRKIPETPESANAISDKEDTGEINLPNKPKKKLMNKFIDFLKS